MFITTGNVQYFPEDMTRHKCGAPDTVKRVQKVQGVKEVQEEHRVQKVQRLQGVQTIHPKLNPINKQ